MKIKIVKEERELEGSIFEGKVKPFGTSAHIPFSKKHTGKVVSVVVPKDPRFIWLISNSEKKTLINSAKKVILKVDGRLRHYQLDLLKDLSKEKFNLDSLEKVIDILEEHKQLTNLTLKLKRIYGLS